MKHLRGKQWAGAITTVSVQQGDNYFEYDDQATIKQLIIENNSAHFCLTKNTPPMTEPLLSELGYLSNMEAANKFWRYLIVTLFPSLWALQSSYQQ
jgi:hypothetical protein